MRISEHGPIAHAGAWLAVGGTIPGLDMAQFALLLCLTLGYWLLAQGSVTAAPLLLVLGYVVLLPMAIIL